MAPPMKSSKGLVSHDSHELVAAAAESSLRPSKGAKASYTWQEVAAHNTPESAWVIVDRVVYDVTAFLDKHPGGREILLVAAGRECTDLFNSYHWWDNTTKARKVMESYRVGVLEGPGEFPSYQPDTAGFYKTLSGRVRAYFERTKQDPKDPFPGLWRLAVIFACAALCYATVHGLVFPGLPFAAKAVVALVFGVFQAMPLLHAMHDASHAAIGHTETGWKVIGRLCLDWFAGGCMITWHHQHTVGHHVYTNVFAADPDLPAGADVRFMSPKLQAWSWVYRFQWLYLPVLYGVLGLMTRIQDVLATYISRTSGPVRVNFYSSPFVRLLVTKSVWAAWRIGVPLLYFRVPASTFWALFLMTEIATGFHLAWNFEVSHVADTVAWHDLATRAGSLAAASEAAGEGVGKGVQGAVGGAAGAAAAAAAAAVARGEIPMSWAVSQAATSVDYSHDSPLTTWWAGALNYQIEHHLFPSISQYHYPALAPIVRAACAEFGVPYRLEPSFWAAWTAHVRYLHTQGLAGRAVKLD